MKNYNAKSNKLNIFYNLEYLKSKINTYKELKIFFNTLIIWKNIVHRIYIEKNVNIYKKYYKKFNSVYVDIFITRVIISFLANDEYILFQKSPFE